MLPPFRKWVDDSEWSEGRTRWNCVSPSFLPKPPEMELGLQEEELSLQKGGKISTSPDGFLEHTFAPG